MNKKKILSSSFALKDHIPLEDVWGFVILQNQELPPERW